MGVTWFLPLLFLYVGALSSGYCGNVSARPAVVHIGALLTYDSTIGRVARIAIEEAVKDVNSDSSILQGITLAMTMQNTNCSGFLGMVQALRFMETDVVAIIGPQCSTVAHMISYVATELQVPLLSFGATDPTLSSLQFPFFVRTTQNDLYQMTAIAEMVAHYGWNSVIAVYVDDDYGRNGVSVLNDELEDRRCRISYKAGIPPGSDVTQADITDVLVKVALMESQVIILHVGIGLGFKVFSVANYLGMTGSGYVWIATDWLATILDTSSPLPSEQMSTIDGVLVLRQHTPDSERKKAFHSRWNNLTGGSLGLSSYGLYAYDSVWLVAHAIDEFLNQGGVISFSNDSRIQSAGSSNLRLDALTIFDGGMSLLNKILQNNVTGLTGPLQFDADRSLVYPAYDIINVVGTGYRQVGYWSNYSGLSTVTPESLYSQPPNRSSANQKLHSVLWPGETFSVPRGWVFPSNGKQLRIGVPVRVGFKEFVSRAKGTDNFKGFCIDVFQAAVNMLPYAVPYQFVPFGDGHKNPSYDELVRLITTDEFDGAVGDIAIVTNRTKIVDFTLPYASSGLVVVAPFKKINSGAWAFLRPFSPRLWLVTAIFFILVGIVVWVLEHKVNDEFRGSPRDQLVTILWFSLSTLFFAHRENTVSTLGRMVLIIWLFVVLIINSSYTASLTSILTVRQLFSPIKGIESLRENDDPIGYQVGSFAEYYLIKELNISKSRLMALGSPEEYSRALELGPDNGGVAAIVDERPYVELFLASQCTFKVVGEEFTKSGWGFAFPRDSPLAVDLSTAILALAENGDLQRTHDKWLRQSNCALENAEIDSDRLQLKSFAGLFLLCGIFCTGALLVYFIQILGKLRQSAPMDSVSNINGSSRSGSLQRFLLLMDEKSVSKSKKRRVESSVSGTDNGDTPRSV